MKEDGFGLVDVIMALVVIGLVLFPAAYLLTSTAQIAGNARTRGVAQSIAEAQLDDLEQSAQATFPPSGLTSSWAAASPSTVTPNSSQTTYYVYEAGGWCMASASSTAGVLWTTAPTPSTTLPSGATVGYFAMVKVAWGSGAAKLTTPYSSVVMSAELPGTTGAPGTGQAMSPSCPLALT